MSQAVCSSVNAPSISTMKVNSHPVSHLPEGERYRLSPARSTLLQFPSPLRFLCLLFGGLFVLCQVSFVLSFCYLFLCRGIFPLWFLISVNSAKEYVLLLLFPLRGGPNQRSPCERIVLLLLFPLRTGPDQRSPCQKMCTVVAVSFKNWS